DRRKLRPSPKSSTTTTPTSTPPSARDEHGPSSSSESLSESLPPPPGSGKSQLVNTPVLGLKSNSNPRVDILAASGFFSATRTSAEVNSVDSSSDDDHHGHHNHLDSEDDSEVEDEIDKLHSSSDLCRAALQSSGSAMEFDRYNASEDDDDGSRGGGEVSEG